MDSKQLHDVRLVTNWAVQQPYNCPIKSSTTAIRTLKDVIAPINQLPGSTGVAWSRPLNGCRPHGTTRNPQVIWEKAASPECYLQLPMLHFPFTLQGAFASPSPPPKKNPHYTREGSGPHLIHYVVPWTHPTYHRKRHLIESSQPFFRNTRSLTTDRQTDRLTERQRNSIYKNRPPPHKLRYIICDARELCCIDGCLIYLCIGYTVQSRVAFWIG